MKIKKYKFSLSTQIIFTLFLVFVSFFVLQSILNFQFFRNYYSDREFESVNASIVSYVDEMNDSDSDYYQEMVDFVSNQNVYSVITTRTFRILDSSYDDYSVKIYDPNTDEEYIFLVPDNALEFDTGETISIRMSLYNNNQYYPLEIIRDTIEIYHSIDGCPTNNCINVTGVISEIYRPDNLNYQFSDNSIIQYELSKLMSGQINYSDYAYEHGYWYKSSDGGTDKLVFIQELKNWDYIVTIVPIEDTDTIIGIVSQYNYYVYLTAVAIIFLWSFRLSAIISKPIQRIEEVARDISNLNFEIVADTYNNKETASLSNSMNLISNNLRDALETLNNKNEELTTLYEEQSKQVELKKQLVSSISHELKTPLMIMQVIIQGISDGVIEKDDIKDELSTVLSEINKSSIMIQDMLQIYRLDDSSTLLDITQFDVSNEIDTLLIEFDQIIKKQTLTIEFDSKSIFIEADLKLLRRAMSNFITNAIKYTPNGGLIKINLAKTDNSFSFEIINYGVNIHNNEIQNIWLPFYRGSMKNYSDHKQTGSGIGLYLVKEILNAHNADYGIVNIHNAVRAYFSIPQKNDS